jgi:hypothetical protein
MMPLFFISIAGSLMDAKSTWMMGAIHIKAIAAMSIIFNKLNILWLKVFL